QARRQHAGRDRRRPWRRGCPRSLSHRITRRSGSASPTPSAVALTALAVPLLVWVRAATASVAASPVPANTDSAQLVRRNPAGCVDGVWRLGRVDHEVMAPFESIQKGAGSHGGISPPVRPPVPSQDLPPWLPERTHPGEPAPSLHPRYRGFTT